VFSVRVPKGATPAAEPVGTREVARLPSSLVELTVLCVDNEPEILAGMSALLSRGGTKTGSRRSRSRTQPAGATARPRVAAAGTRSSRRRSPLRSGSA
jgi:hypothetical protein